MNHSVLNRAFAVTSLSIAILLSGCNNDDNNNTGSSAPPVGVVTSAKAYTNTTTSPVTNTSETISYSMPGVSGGVVDATAVVLIPKGTAPTGGWPIVVWGHGTTGVADKCAPSNPELNLAGYAQLLAGIVNAGYAVVAPDYEGLGSAGLHPFLNANSEGNSMIYAVKAAKEKYSLSSRWMAAGHSQGGHAAIAAAERASTIGLDFKGAVAFAPASNLDSIILAGYSFVNVTLQNNVTSTAIKTLPGLQAFSALTVAGIRQSRPAFNYSSVFTSDSSAKIAQSAEQNCLDELTNNFGTDISSYYSDTANAKLLYPGLSINFSSNSNVIEFLEASKIAKFPISQPLLILQGQQDATVPAGITQLLQAQLTSKMAANNVPANRLQVIYNANADHGSIVGLGAPQMLQFIAQNLPAR